MKIPNFPSREGKHATFARHARSRLDQLLNADPAPIAKVSVFTSSVSKGSGMDRLLAGGPFDVARPTAQPSAARTRGKTSQLIASRSISGQRVSCDARVS